MLINIDDSASKKIYMCILAGLLGLSLVSCGATAWLWRSEVKSTDKASANAIDVNDNGEIFDAFSIGNANYLRKLGPDGMERWRQPLGNAVGGIGLNLVKVYAQGALVVNRTAQPTMLQKLDANGHIEWEKNIQLAGANIGAQTITEDSAQLIHLGAADNSGAYDLVYDAAGNQIRSVKLGSKPNTTVQIAEVGQYGVVTLIGESYGFAHLDYTLQFENLNGKISWILPIDSSIPYPRTLSVGNDNSIFVYSVTQISQVDIGGNLVWSGDGFSNITQLTSDQAGNIYYANSEQYQNGEIAKLSANHEPVFSIKINPTGTVSIQEFSLAKNDTRIIAKLTEEDGLLAGSVTRTNSVQVLNATNGQVLVTHVGKSAVFPQSCMPIQICISNPNYYVSGDSFYQVKSIQNNKVIVNGETTAGNGPVTEFVTAYALP